MLMVIKILCDVISCILCHSVVNLFATQLQTSLLMFPGLLHPLLDKCGIAADRSVQDHHYFGMEAQLRFMFPCFLHLICIFCHYIQ